MSRSKALFQLSIARPRQKHVPKIGIILLSPGVARFRGHHLIVSMATECNCPGISLTRFGKYVIDDIRLYGQHKFCRQSA